MSDENKTLDQKLAGALKGIWDSLTDEQKEKAKACKTVDELTALAAKEGVELPDELLEAVSGGYVVQYLDEEGTCLTNQLLLYYYAVNDSDGKLIDYFPVANGLTQEGAKAAAEACAKANGQSTKMLTVSEWEDVKYNALSWQEKLRRGDIRIRC